MSKAYDHKQGIDCQQCYPLLKSVVCGVGPHMDTFVQLNLQRRNIERFLLVMKNVSFQKDVKDRKFLLCI